MLTPEEKAAGKIEWKDVPPGSYIDLGGFREDELPNIVSRIPKTLDIAAFAAFCLGGAMYSIAEDAHWFRYAAFAGWGAAVGFWLAARMAMNAIFLQSNIDREKRASRNR